MKTKPELDAELDRLARMLPPWLERLRHPAQFWPQFDALAQEILADAGADDRVYVLQRLDAMLIDNEGPWTGYGCGAAPPYFVPGLRRSGTGH